MYEVYVHRDGKAELDLQGYGDDQGRYLSAGHAYERAKEIASSGQSATVVIDRTLTPGGPREVLAQFNPKP